MEEKADNQSRKNRMKEFFQVSEVIGYFFRKRNPSRPKNFNIRAMHTINKIAIVMFLICVLVILKRCVFGYD